MAHKHVKEAVEDQDEDEEVHSVDVETLNIININSKSPRLPRWTRQELLVLIQGKKMAESRVRRVRTTMISGSGSGVEPKWATISAYCKRHGVNRGPVQCRKRWSNLAGDFKKIKEWEANVKDESDSFWLLRNDLRRNRKLPGFFDKEVFDILNGTAAHHAAVPELVDDGPEPPSPRMLLFDSGRTGVDALFRDFEHTEVDDDELSPTPAEPNQEHINDHHHIAVAISAPAPISEKQYQPVSEDATGPGSHEKQPESKPEIESTSQRGRKRRRGEKEGDGEEVSLEEHLIKVLERNDRILSDQLKAQNSNLKLDREERKEQATSLVAVLNRLADSLAKIADKL